MSSPLKRALDIRSLLEKKSVLLLGPRATGKSTLIKQEVPKAIVFDLLDRKTYRDLLKNTALIEETCGPNPQGPIVIDEIQKIPEVLDDVHRLIEKYGYRFLLTGSSARKLKRGSANLLAGRAWKAEMFPLTYHEIPQFNLLRYLNTGGLPAIYYSKDAEEDLKSYVGLYLKEEVQSESLTRNLAGFSEFLTLLGRSNGQEINFESFGSDCGVSPITIKNYISILEDTLVGFQLPGFTKTKKRKAISRSKFYFFDVGVGGYLAERGAIVARSEEFGKAFEHFVIQEIRAYLSYKRKNLSLSYWRSTSKFEVDLIVGNEWAIEIKSTDSIQERHLKGLKALQEEKLIKNLAVVTMSEKKRHHPSGITIYPWELFLRDLWAGKCF